MSSGTEIALAGNSGYAIRYKVSDGGAMIYTRDGQLWSLTNKYFKRIVPELVDNYDDWQLMDRAKHQAYFDLIESALAGNTAISIHGRVVTVPEPIATIDAVPDGSPASPAIVTEAALKSAGQVAEALGIAIGSFAQIDPEKASAALKELIWIAKNVGWQTKENRNQFNTYKWKEKNDARTPAKASETGSPESQGGTDSQTE